MSRKTLLKLLAVAALVAAGFVVPQTPLGPYLDPRTLNREAEALSRSAITPLALLAAWLVTGVVALPAWALMLAAGIVYGGPLGAVLSFGGAAAGATFGYLLGRTLAPDDTATLRPAALHGLVVLLRRESLPIVLLARATLVTPFMAVNLASGAAGMHFPSFLSGTVFGMAGPIILWANVGDVLLEHGLRGLLVEGRWVAPALAALTALATVVGVQLFRRARERRAASGSPAGGATLTPTGQIAAGPAKE